MKILLILVLFFSFSSSLKAEEIDAKKTYIKTLTEYLELRIKNDNSGLKNLPLTQEKVLDRQPVLISFTIDGKGFLLDSFFEKKSKQEIINDRIDRLITFLFLNLFIIFIFIVTQLIHSSLMLYFSLQVNAFIIIKVHNSHFLSYILQLLEKIWHSIIIQYLYVEFLQYFFLIFF
jgi:hypothetical protein